MKIRSSLIAFGLALAATSAFAATPQPAAAGKTVKHHERTCEQRSKMGKCEKWSDAKQTKQDATAAAKKS